MVTIQLGELKRVTRGYVLISGQKMVFRACAAEIQPQGVRRDHTMARFGAVKFYLETPPQSNRKTLYPGLVQT